MTSAHFGMRLGFAGEMKSGMDNTCNDDNLMTESGVPRSCGGTTMRTNKDHPYAWYRSIIIP